MILWNLGQIVEGSNLENLELNSNYLKLRLLTIFNQYWFQFSLFDPVLNLWKHKAVNCYQTYLFQQTNSFVDPKEEQVLYKRVYRIYSIDGNQAINCWTKSLSEFTKRSPSFAKCFLMGAFNLHSFCSSPFNIDQIATRSSWGAKLNAVWDWCSTVVL